MKTNNLLGKLWVQISKGLFKDLLKLWPSLIFLSAVGTINALGLTKPIINLSGEPYLSANGKLIVDATNWYNGILILAEIAWMLILGAHIVQEKRYQIIHGDIIDTHTGNSNWVSGILIGLGLFVFLILQAPIIPTLLITALTVMFYAGRGRFHEQGEFELPKLANLVIVLLAVWQIAIG